MNTESLIDSLDRDEALGFFQEGLPSGNNVISQTQEDTEEDKSKVVDPRKNPNFNKSMEEVDFEINDLIKETIPQVLEDDRKDLLEKEEEDIEEDKTPIVETSTYKYSNFVGEGLLKPFEDQEEINTEDEFKELLTANLQNEYEKGKEEGTAAILSNIPEELKTVVEYALKGGTDIKGMFSKFNEKSFVKDLDIENEKDQEEIVRQVLRSQDLSEEEIQEEIESYKDLDSLKRMATKLKPRLDKLKEKNIEQELKKQEELVQMAEEQKQNYTKTISDTLSKGDVFGYKVNDKLKDSLVNGMSNLNYPSITGNKTNLLGRLLEKYQFEEPDMERIMAATMILLDPKEFFNNIKLENKKEVEKEAIRRIKNVDTSATVTEKQINPAKPKVNKTNNFYRPF